MECKFPGMSKTFADLKAGDCFLIYLKNETNVALKLSRDERQTPTLAAIELT